MPVHFLYFNYDKSDNKWTKILVLILFNLSFLNYWFVYAAEIENSPPSFGDILEKFKVSLNFSHFILLEMCSSEVEQLSFVNDEYHPVVGKQMDLLKYF